MEIDDIIVGAGSSGAVLAARLSEDPARRVLLLEAGPDYASLAETPADLLGPDPSLRDHDWALRAETHAGRRIPFPRAKVVGGCSAVNGAVALRGVPADYDEWAELGNPEWAWSKILPYFKRLESDELGESALHGGHGPIPVRRFKRDEQHPTQRAAYDAYRALGFADVVDHNEPSATGVGPIPLNLRDNTRVSTALGYLKSSASCRGDDHCGSLPVAIMISAPCLLRRTCRIPSPIWRRVCCALTGLRASQHRRRHERVRSRGQRARVWVDRALRGRERRLVHGARHRVPRQSGQHCQLQAPCRRRPSTEPGREVLRAASSRSTQC